MKKKVLILQLLGKSYGGIWQVNRVIGEEFLKNGYDVTVLNLRDNKTDITVSHDSKLKIDTINKESDWDYPLKSEVIKFKISVFDYFKRLKRVKDDYKKMGDYIEEFKPDYIIVSHYLLLNAVPNNYLSKTIYQQHSSAKYAFSQKGNTKTLFKFNNKVTYLWLCEASCNEAKKRGLNNCHYIYNAVRFNSKERANVIENKKIVTIARLSYEKRIDLMIKIVSELFLENESLNDWIFEIYGNGEEEESLKNLDYDKKRIKLMGVTDDPKKVLLSSSINLNTSLFEGFCLSILEANECGVPTIAFAFGESVNEQIKNDDTGIVATDIEDYKKKLLLLMSDKNKLDSMSVSCKKFNEMFRIETIIKEWLDLFGEIDTNH